MKAISHYHSTNLIISSLICGGTALHPINLHAPQRPADFKSFSPRTWYISAGCVSIDYEGICVYMSLVQLFSHPYQTMKFVMSPGPVWIPYLVCFFRHIQYLQSNIDNSKSRARRCHGKEMGSDQNAVSEGRLIMMVSQVDVLVRIDQKSKGTKMMSVCKNRSSTSPQSP